MSRGTSDPLSMFMYQTRVAKTPTNRSEVSRGTGDPSFMFMHQTRMLKTPTNRSEVCRGTGDPSFMFTHQTRRLKTPTNRSEVCRGTGDPSFMFTHQTRRLKLYQRLLSADPFFMFSLYPLLVPENENLGRPYIISSDSIFFSPTLSCD